MIDRFDSATLRRGGGWYSLTPMALCATWPRRWPEYWRVQGDRSFPPRRRYIAGTGGRQRSRENSVKGKHNRSRRCCGDHLACALVDLSTPFAKVAVTTRSATLPKPLRKCLSSRTVYATPAHGIHYLFQASFWRYAKSAQSTMPRSSRLYRQVQSPS